MAEEQTKFGKALDKVPGVIGTGLGILRSIGDAIRRKPNVRAWAKAKRQFKRSLRKEGLDKPAQIQRLQAWLSQNPRPRGNDPYDPTALGQSNQVDASNNSQVGSFDPFGGSIKAPGAPLPNNLGTRTAGSGLGFNPLWLLLAIPFVFPNQFKKLTKIKY